MGSKTKWLGCSCSLSSWIKSVGHRVLHQPLEWSVYPTLVKFMIISNRDSTSRAHLWLCVWIERGNSVTYVIMQQCIFPYMANVNLTCNISFQLSLANILTHYDDNCWQLEGCAYLDVPCWKILEYEVDKSSTLLTWVPAKLSYIIGIHPNLPSYRFI